MTHTHAFYALMLSMLLVASVAQGHENRVPKTLTPLTDIELLDVLRETHRETYGVVPGKNKLAMVWAHVAAENGHGRLVYNHNLGNIGALGDRPFYNVSGHHYRHFETFEEGARAYWATVYRCKAAIQSFSFGDASGAAKYLRRCGYYEADLGPYARALTSLYLYAYSVVIPEDRDRHQNEQLTHEWQERETLAQFTPACGCCK